MKANCFKKFSQIYLKKYTVKGIDFTGEGRLSMKVWARDLKLALIENPSDFVIGHSFGGMLLLSTVGLEGHVKGRIIMSASPDLDWVNNLGKFQLTKRELNTIDIATRKFERSPSVSSLKGLWKSWAPYYFTKRHRKAGGRWLASQGYLLRPYQASKSLIKGYEWLPSASQPTLYVGGKQDKLTPVSAFKMHMSVKNYTKSTEEITGSGHFCWFDAPERLASVLLTFIEEVLEETK